MLVFASPPDGEPVLTAVAGVLVVAALMGLVAAWIMYQVTWWPSELLLTLRDRSRVMRSVAWGQGPSESRVASSVIKLATRVLDRTAQPSLNSRVERYGLGLLLCAIIAGSLGWMIFLIVNGRVTSLLLLWGSALVGALLGPRQEELVTEIRTNAERAKAAAQALLPADQTDA